MNNAKAVAALNTISMAFGELAEAIGEGATAPVLTPLAANEGVPDFPPIEYEALPIAADAPGLGRCPNHGTPWQIKEAGVSKAGKPFNSFYKCDGKDPDGTWCSKRPVKSWADAHPIAA